MAEPSTSGAGASATPAPSASWLSGLKANLRKYGKTGIAVYLGISFSVTAGFYVAIEQHLDVKKFLGMKDSDDERELSFFEKMVAGKGSTLALAILCSKACVPIKLPVAVAVTPYVHRITQNLLRGAAAKGS